MSTPSPNITAGLVGDYSGQKAYKQCMVNETQYDGDSTGNPIFEGGGSIGTYTLSICKSFCSLRTDSYGRQCVAIEWSDGGQTLSSDSTADCALGICRYIDGSSLHTQNLRSSCVCAQRGAAITLRIGMAGPCISVTITLSVCEGVCSFSGDVDWSAVTLLASIQPDPYTVIHR